MPTTRQLELFITIADAGSMRRAADRLGISQPSISKQMKALERSVGGELLVRIRGERAVLSPLGAELLEDARSSVALQHRFMQRRSGGASRPLRIFIRPYLLERVKGLLGALAEAGLPEDAAFLVNDDPAEALAHDEEGGNNVAVFNAMRLPFRPEFVSHVLFEHYCAIFAAPEVAADLKSGELPMRELAVLLPARNFRLTPWLLAQIQALGFEPGEQRFCTQFIDLIVERVCQGEGVGLFMEDHTQPLVDSGRLVRIARCPDPLMMVLMARPDIDPDVFERVRRSLYVLGTLQRRVSS